MTQNSKNAERKKLYIYNSYQCLFLQQWLDPHQTQNRTNSENKSLQSRNKVRRCMLEWVLHDHKFLWALFVQMLISRRIAHGKHSANPSLPTKFPMFSYFKHATIPSQFPWNLKKVQPYWISLKRASHFAGLCHHCWHPGIVKAYTGICPL